MATIVNKSEFTISVNPTDGPAFIIPPKGSDDRLNDTQARAWAERSNNSFTRVGYIIVRYDEVQRSAAATAAPKSQIEAEPPADGNLADMHWRVAKSKVQTIDDLDLLADLHVSETRNKVRDAIEDRMKELQLGNAVRNAG